jgi:flagellar assembly protein FliH
MTSSKPNHRQVPPPTPATPAARSAAGYARFIPREELGGFAAWQPDAFGQAGAPQAEPGAAPPPRNTQGRNGPAAPPPPPPEPPSAAEVEAELRVAWEARVLEARQQGWQDGYRDGLAALEAAKRQFAQQTSAQFSALISSFDAGTVALETQLAEAVAHSAVRLAKQVVRSELALRPECVTQVAREAMNAIVLSAKHLRISLHPDDFALVQSEAADALAARDVLLQADPTLSRGGCVVESDLGGVDARIETRWAQAAAVFQVPLGWAEPELPTVEGSTP